VACPRLLKVLVTVMIGFVDSGPPRYNGEDTFGEYMNPNGQKGVENMVLPMVSLHGQQHLGNRSRPQSKSPQME